MAILGVLDATERPLRGELRFFRGQASASKIVFEQLKV